MRRARPHTGRSDLQILNQNAEMIFVSYAPNFPTYTFGFLNAKTGRINHSQDAIFLPNEFLFRDARVRLGSEPAGDTLLPRVLVRSL